MANEKPSFRKHIFYLLVENRSGVLTRVAGLFSARGFNIESLSVAETQKPEVSRMTIVVPGDDKILDQVRKQIDRLVDVYEAHDFSVEDREIINRELVLIKIKSDAATRSEIVQVANIFRAHISDVSPESLVVEAIGSETKIAGLLKLLQPYGIIELARGGRVAMARGQEDSSPAFQAVV